MKTKIVSPFFICLIFASFLATEVMSQSPTPEVSTTTEESVGDKVKEIREAVKEKVREKIEEIQQGQKRAYVGEITKISNSTLVLDSRSGELQVKTDDESVVIGSSRKEIDFKDLEIGNYIIAMGYVGENNVLQAKRVVVSQKPKTPSREVAVGRVTDISADENIITVKNEKKDIIYMVEATTKTVITKKIEDKVEKIKFNQITEDDWIVAVGAPSENEEKIITAKLIHTIPGKNKLQPSPSPEPTPTPTEEE